MRRKNCAVLQSHTGFPLVHFFVTISNQNKLFWRLFDLGKFKGCHRRIADPSFAKGNKVLQVRFHCFTSLVPGFARGRKKVCFVE